MNPHVAYIHIPSSSSPSLELHSDTVWGDDLRLVWAQRAGHHLTVHILYTALMGSLMAPDAAVVGQPGKIPTRSETLKTEAVQR